jgi:hypothetical protein
VNVMIVTDKMRKCESKGLMASFEVLTKRLSGWCVETLVKRVGLESGNRTSI